MEKKMLVAELKSIVSSGSILAAKEAAWMEQFLKFAVDSIDVNKERSEASQAVSVFLALCKDAGLWDCKVTPLSFRRKCRKDGVQESALVTALCRLEGKIRDMFRSSRTNNTATEPAEPAEPATPEPETPEPETPEPATPDALRRVRLEGMLLVLQGILSWVRSTASADINRGALLVELSRSIDQIRAQL